METSSETGYIAWGTEAHRGSALLLSWSHLTSCPWPAQLSEGAPPAFQHPSRQTCPLAFNLSYYSPYSCKTFLKHHQLTIVFPV